MEKKITISRALFATILLTAMALVLVLVGCGSNVSKGDTVGGSSATDESVATATAENTAAGSDEDAPTIPGLTYEKKTDLQYATGFDVYYYDDGYKLIDIHDDTRYLVVPEGKEIPAGLDSAIVVLQQPLDHIYLCATASMSLFSALDSMDNVTMTGTDTPGWNIQAPKDALASGKLVYAGKYSAPDYEMLVDNGCDLAIESTMILHSPEVQEMIEQLGIPVFVEHSSSEGTPLGRTEWVKVYGAMLGKEDVADAFFASQAAVMDEMEQYENTGKTVVFFSISTDGSVVVRRPDDYIAQSIEIAGGTYAFRDLAGTGKATTVDMTMEQFYETAVNADYLVYNGTIEGPISSVAELEAKSSTFADYKAVQNGNVWTCDKTMYQSTDKIAQMIEDFHVLVTTGDESQMTFLTKVD